MCNARWLDIIQDTQATSSLARASEWVAGDYKLYNNVWTGLRRKNNIYIKISPVRRLTVDF